MFYGSDLTAHLPAFTHHLMMFRESKLDFLSPIPLQFS